MAILATRRSLSTIICQAPFECEPWHLRSICSIWGRSKVLHFSLLAFLRSRMRLLKPLFLLRPEMAQKHPDRQRSVMVALLNEPGVDPPPSVEHLLMGRRRPLLRST